MSDATVIASYWRWPPSEIKQLRAAEREYWARVAARHMDLDVEEAGA